MINFTKIHNWIFDMDGTLTVPLHDFNEIRRIIGVPADEDIIAFIKRQDRERALLIHKKLEEIELDFANKAQPQPGVKPFLRFLQNRGDNLGLLTRNNKVHTEITLLKTGLLEFFDETNILTREFKPAKPSPEPVFYFLTKWNVSAKETVIIGDYKHDIESGRAADVGTIYFDSKESDDWTDMADATYTTWDILREEL
ncbi:MAG: HAD family hydrolase [Fibrobacterota bacterium]